MLIEIGIKLIEETISNIDCKEFSLGLHDLSELTQRVWIKLPTSQQNNSVNFSISFLSMFTDPCSTSVQARRRNKIFSVLLMTEINQRE